MKADSILKILPAAIIISSMMLLYSPVLFAQQDPPPAEEDFEGEIDRPPMDDEATWGPDSAEAVRCHSLYRSYVRDDRYEDALDHWRCNYQLAPRSTLHIYVDGVRILRTMIENAETEDDKAAYLDTLMQLYDDRIKHFGNEGFVLGRKGVDLLRHDRSQIPQAFAYMDSSITHRGKETEYSLPFTYLITLNRMYNADRVEEDAYIDKFANVVDIIQYNIHDEEGEYHEEWLSVRDMIINDSRNFLNCDQLEKIYKRQAEEYPEDEGLYAHMMEFLDEVQCKGEDYYYTVAERYYEFNPNADIAAELASLYEEEGDQEKAEELYNEAIDMEENETRKARHYFSLANIYMDREDYPTAKQMAQRAIELDPNWGIPYLFIGNLYVQGASTCTEGIEERIVYLIAVDYYQQAKDVDPNTQERSEKLIQTYSEHFPQTEDIFFHGLEEGQIYEIGCWINETTTIRTKES